MRISNWLIATALAVVGAVAPGCATEPGVGDPPPPPPTGRSTPLPGVVEIYRYVDGVVFPAAYVCPDDAHPGYSYWLLPANVTPPIRPASTSRSEDLIWHLINTEHPTCQEFRDIYGPDIPGATLWHVNGTTWVCTIVKK